MSELRPDDEGGWSPVWDALRRYNVQILYGVSGLAYITLGIFVKQVLALWIEGAAFLLLTVWLLPALVRRIRELL